MSSMPPRSPAFENDGQGGEAMRPSMPANGAVG